MKAALSNDVCVPVGHRFWIVYTLIFFSIAYDCCSSICHTSFCLCFWWPLKYRAEGPPEVSQTSLQCVTQFLSTPITMLTIQQPLASGITCVSPLIKFSEEFLECVVTVGRICSLLRALSGISAVWLLKQFLNVHLLFRYTVKKQNKTKIPVRFPNILTLHSRIWVVSFFWTFLIWTGRILFST